MVNEELDAVTDFNLVHSALTSLFKTVRPYKACCWSGSAAAKSHTSQAVPAGDAARWRSGRSGFRPIFFSLLWHFEFGSDGVKASKDLIASFEVVADRVPLFFFCYLTYFSSINTILWKNGCRYICWLIYISHTLSKQTSNKCISHIDVEHTAHRRKGRI